MEKEKEKHKDKEKDKQKGPEAEGEAVGQQKTELAAAAQDVVVADGAKGKEGKGSLLPDMLLEDICVFCASFRFWSPHWRSMG